MAVGDFKQDHLFHEEHAELVRVDVVHDELVQELQNKDATLVDLLAIGCLHLRIHRLPRVLALLLLVFHLRVNDASLGILGSEKSPSFGLLHALYRVFL